MGLEGGLDDGAEGAVEARRGGFGRLVDCGLGSGLGDPPGPPLRFRSGGGRGLKCHVELELFEGVAKTRRGGW